MDIKLQHCESQIDIIELDHKQAASDFETLDIHLPDATELPT